MRKTTLLLIVSFVAVALAGGYGGYRRWLARHEPKWRTAEVVQGDIVDEVHATGTIRPVLSVVIGSFVSGPIRECLVDFNDEVKKGDLLAVVDKRLFEANVARDEAALATRLAEVARVKAELQRAINDEGRARKLRSVNREYLSDSEMDQFRFARMALEAQLRVAEKSVESAQAALRNSRANLAYCEIRSPVDGIVIDRKIDPGQTVAAAFQTPELFIVAPDLRKEIHIYAQVDETDIGRVREAARTKQPVRFQVDAYPESIFTGKIHQVRLSSSETQNVVTYPVIVSAGNPDLKLLPGMTASLSFQIEHKKGVVKIPNAALRFYPKIEHVREEDKKLLEGRRQQTSDDEDAAESDTAYSVRARVEAYRKRYHRHVWIWENGKLRAIPVRIGISDHRYTELVEGDLKPGIKLVTGEEL